MTVITLKGEIDKNGVLIIKHLAFSPEKEVKVAVVIEEPKTCDFSDLAGKLSWLGDGLALQKKIRNEWD